MSESTDAEILEARKKMEEKFGNLQIGGKGSQRRKKEAKHREAIKNIDYDLDVKVFPNNEYIVLDENEFEYHSNIMNYPNDIKKICVDAKDELIKMIENKENPFDFSYINNYILEYFELISSENKENNELIKQ